MTTIRKNAQVRYIGKDELGKGKVFTVRRKDGAFVSVYFPTRYMDGSIHNSLVALPVDDFELI